MDQFSYLPTVPPPSPPFPSSSSSSPFISPPQPAEDHGHDEWTFEDNQALEEALAEFDFGSPAPPFPSSSSSTLCISQPQLAEGHSDQWTFEENKRFEDALAEFDLGAPDLFVNIQTRVPGKTLWQIKKHLDDLYEDIDNIEKGIIPIPDYKTTPTQVKSNPKSKTTRKKGVTWTEEEHKLFLEGLQKYGKGDWKSISRHCVVSRNPTQVASHAQKYFLRLQNSAGYEQGGGRDETASLQNHAHQVPERRKYKKRSKA